MMYNIKAGRVGFYHEVNENLSLLVQHWDNVIIRDELPEDGDISKSYKAITRKGDDHFAISSMYAMVGMEKIMKMARGGSSNGQVTTLSSVANDEVTVDDLFKNVTKTNINYEIY